ncbi:MAG: hypothetical protein KF866_05070 [Phycisphaeraceae bacterium]|nr:hypothetical protein [Phycisphaeraceae bacterium]MCW5755484.1 hypothetical protein [Phycisphaeraceae bacterium]
MSPIVIESRHLRLVVAPDLGAGVQRLDLCAPGGEWRPLWRAAPDNSTHFNDLAMYVLAPWSNRIAAGTFAHHDTLIRLTPDWPDGTAIHGCIKDRPFHLLDRSPVSARLELLSSDHPDLAWPCAFRCIVRYELDESTLHVAARVTHACLRCPFGTPDGTMPAGLGFHPFFMRTLWAEDTPEIQVPVVKRYPASGMLPIAAPQDDAISRTLREGTPLHNLNLDDCFLGNPHGAIIRYPSSGVRVHMSATPTCTHTVLYTGGKEENLPYFCLEPVTMANNGFNIRGRGWSSGVQELSPGDALEARFSLTVESA